MCPYFYLKHQIFYLGIIQIRSHHSSQQAYIPCNLWRDSWIPCHGHQFRVIFAILSCELQLHDSAHHQIYYPKKGEKAMYHHDHHPSKKKTE